MVNMGELFAFDRISDQPMERVPLTSDERERFILEEGDLLFARQSLVRDGAGRVVYVESGAEDRTWDSHLIRVRLDQGLACPLFYFYFFRSPQGRRLVETIIEQVAAAGIRGSDLGRLRVPVPTLAEQRKIARVLGTLDEKIEQNRKTCLIIDALAKAEVEAAQVSATRFVRLGDLVQRVNEMVKPSELGEDTAYVSLVHMARGSLFLPQWASAEGLGSGKARFHEGDILFGKLRPYFKKVAIAPFDGVCSTDILVLRARRPDQRAFALVVLGSDPVINYASAGSHGTRMPRVSWEYLAAWPVAIPNDDLASSVQEHLAPMLAYGVHLTKQSIILAELRESLAPRLVSGDLRAGDAKPLVEALV